MAERKKESAEEKVLPKKLIIIIVTVVTLLIVIGGGAAFLFMKDSTSVQENIEQIEEESAVPTEKFYFDMSKPIVVDFPKGSAVKHGRISLSMLIEDAETMSVLKKNEPMILNNLLMLIGSQDSGVLNTREGKDVLRNAILENMNAVLKKMAGKGHVEEVFFTSFVMQ